MKALLAALLVALALALPAAAQDGPDLIDAMAERLALMEGVARAKWNAGRPIEDLAREEVVLTAVTGQATAAGLDQETARAFFQAQITAAKQVQQRRFDLWTGQGQGDFAQAPDLTEELRPAISALTARIIDGLKALPADPGEICAQLSAPPPAILRDDGDAWRTALSPLAARCP